MTRVSTPNKVTPSVVLVGECIGMVDDTAGRATPTAPVVNVRVGPVAIVAPAITSWRNW